MCGKTLIMEIILHLQKLFFLVEVIVWAYYVSTEEHLTDSDILQN